MSKLKNTIFIGLLLLGISSIGVAIAQDEGGTCLNGFELTAIVVLETDIRQSVSAFACRMTFPEDPSTYDLYNQLRDKWKDKRSSEHAMRDSVYQRIYGDAWQGKVEDWTQTMAIAQSELFKPDDITCQDLRNEMGAQAHDWLLLYESAAREAAQAKYDPLRCATSSQIIIKHSKAAE